MASLVSALVAGLPEWLHPALRALLLSTLKLGPLPAHIAFIMDGNRRHALNHAQPLQVAHEQGFEALKRILESFLELRVKCVTVFAFSLENFNRDQAEVEGLMALARSRLVEICEKGALLDQHGVKIRILGRRDLLPLDVQASCARAEKLTEGNTQGILNFCCPYTSREEMTTAMEQTILRYNSVDLKPSEITPEMIELNLYTVDSPPLDILIRTSGVNRLSDFLLWQSNETTTIHFIAPNWPDIGLVHVCPPLLMYQVDYISRRIAHTLALPFGWARSCRTKVE